MNGGVVKLDALTDTDRTRAEHDYLLFIGKAGLILAGVGGIKICYVAAGVEGIDHAERGDDTAFAAQLVYINLGEVPEQCDVLIREAHDLCLAQQREIVRRGSELLLHINDARDTLEKQLGYHGSLMQTLDALAAAQELRYRIYIVVMEHRNVRQQLSAAYRIEALETEMAHTYLERTDRFKEALLKGRADTHDLTRCLHLRTESIRNGSKLIEREARELCNDIVEARSDSCRAARNGYLGKGHADRYLCGNARDGITARFGGKRGGARNSRIDLDEIIAARAGIERKLDIAAAGYLEFTDDAQRTVAEHVAVAVGERENGCNDDGVAGVNADRVDIFHAADRDGVIVAVAHYLELYLLIALDALLDEHLMNGRECERIRSKLLKLRSILGKAAASTSESERGTQNYRVADALCRSSRLLDIIGYLGRDDRLAYRLAHLLEQFSVLCALDALAARTEQLNTAFAEDALLLELHCKVKTGLSADAGNYRVGALVTDYLCYIFKRKRLHVHLVRDGGIRHDRRGV